jgi:hypothetical protein
MYKDNSETRVVRLNLIYDYPVKWSKFKVLRDLIQNFYDSLGYKKWHKNFSYEITNNVLNCESCEVSFSYDWLLHIGASTKRGKESEYAGYFGEGFKIASLCALRDYGWKIEMYSRDWGLEVVTDGTLVDGVYLKSLAYRVWNLKESLKNTILKLSPFFSSDGEIFESALLSFFYPENPLFGKEIWSSDSAAVFYRSKKDKPRHYPSTFDYYGEGIIFAGYQAMGSFPHSLIFCLHTYRPKGRERDSFYQMDVIDNIKRVVSKLPPEAAFEVLEVLRSRWYEYPRKKYDFDTWYGILNELTGRIADSEEHVNKWTKKYPTLLVAIKKKRNDIAAFNKRTQALAWLHRQPQKYRLVQDGFLELGYPTLEEVCEKAGGFSYASEPVGIEVELIVLLENTASLLLKTPLGDIKLPPCKVIREKNPAWKGMANLILLKKPVDTPSGIKIRYNLSYICLKNDLFVHGGFGSALGTYLHELTHCFGGDKSANFSHALSTILDVVLDNTLVIEAFRMAWDKKFAPKTGGSGKKKMTVP